MVSQDLFPARGRTIRKVLDACQSERFESQLSRVRHVIYPVGSNMHSPPFEKCKSKCAKRTNVSPLRRENAYVPKPTTTKNPARSKYQKALSVLKSELEPYRLIFF